MNERQKNIPNEGSVYYGQSVGLPLDSTLETIRFLGTIESKNFPEELSTSFYEGEDGVEAWVGHYLNKIAINKDNEKSTVEVELQDESQGAIWLDIDERDVMVGGYPKVEMSHSNDYYCHKDDEFRHHDNNEYRHRFSDYYAMRAAELVLRLATKRFADVGFAIARDNATNAEETLRQKLAREREAMAHFESVLE